MGETPACHVVALNDKRSYCRKLRFMQIVLFFSVCELSDDLAKNI